MVAAQDFADPLDRALRALLCPVCGLDFTASSAQGPSSVHCANGHSYDFSRQHVLNLLTGKGSKFRPDAPAMVAARERFLTADHYLPLTQAVTAHARSLMRQSATEAPTVAELGCGTGYYLEAVTGALTTERPPAAVGLDLSPAALKLLSRRLPGSLAVAWDVWRPLPLAAKTVDLALVIFAPRPLAEIHRVLASTGAAVIVTAEPEHLAQLPNLPGLLHPATGKSEAIARAAQGLFTVETQKPLHFTCELDAAGVTDLISMGPSGHHTQADDVERQVRGELGEGTLQLEAAMRVHVLRPLPDDAAPSELALRMRSNML